MKTTYTIPATIIALSLALAGAARADTGGPTDVATARSVAVAYVGGNAQRLPGNPGAPAGSIALLTGAASGYPLDTPVFASISGGAPAGSIALLTRASPAVMARNDAGATVLAQYRGASEGFIGRGEAGIVSATQTQAGANAGVSRAEVKSEVAGEQRAGELPAPGDRGDETLAQKFPWKFEGSTTKNSAGMASDSAI
jgi:hypothetical protein